MSEKCFSLAFLSFPPFKLGKGAFQACFKLYLKFLGFPFERRPEKLQKSVQARDKEKNADDGYKFLVPGEFRNFRRRIVRGERRHEQDEQNAKHEKDAIADGADEPHRLFPSMYLLSGVLRAIHGSASRLFAERFPYFRRKGGSDAH